MNAPLSSPRPRNGAWIPVETLDPWPAWRGFVGKTGPWAGEDLIRALLLKFCRGVWLEDESNFRSLAGTPVLFLANHQVAVESILFAAALSPFLGAPVHAIAKQEHAGTWVGQLFGQLATHPGVQPLDTTFFYRLGDANALLELIETLKATMEARRCGLLVHAAASRVLTCRSAVRTLSSVFIDLAIRGRFSIVPVKFRGGLPAAPLEGFLDFPVGYGAQDFCVGRAITPDDLTRVPFRERRDLVLDRINTLGGDLADETPAPADPGFGRDVAAFMERYGVLEPAFAVLWAALKRLPAPTPAIAEMLAGIDAGHLTTGASPQDRWTAQVTRWLTENRMPVAVRTA